MVIKDFTYFYTTYRNIRFIISVRNHSKNIQNKEVYIEMEHTEKDLAIVLNRYKRCVKF